MRGLLGNAYTKILINDIPIKPAFVNGLPIGAQLPIKEAERIEIIYGTGAALYGADAAAGVINIITRQSEKPVYMQADLSVGAGEYSSASVMFGGKLGRDKNLFHYFAYGSNVLLESRRTFYDKEFNYHPGSYTNLSLNDSSFVHLPNYAGTADSPILTNTPHLSRKFGIGIKFRQLTVSAETMSRRDHSSIGLNPVAVSYRNPLTYTGENIFRLNVNFYKDFEKKNRKTDITYLRYQLDDRSSILMVKNELAKELEFAAIAEANRIGAATSTEFKALKDSIFRLDYDRFMNGSRFMYGFSHELRVERVHNYLLFNSVSLTAGANVKFAVGSPFTPYLSRPLVEDSDQIVNGFSFEGSDYDSTTFPLIPDELINVETNLFGQAFYDGKRFNLVAGFNYSSFSSFGDRKNQIDVFLPRFAALWKVNETINVRSSWGKSYRAPNDYQRSNTFIISSENTPKIAKKDLPPSAETTTSWESGIRFKKGNYVDFDATYFTSETINLSNYNTVGSFNHNNTSYTSDLGYFTLRDSEIKFRGGQFIMYFDNLMVNDKKILGINWSISWIKTKIKLSDENTTVAIPQLSSRIHQTRFFVWPTENTTLIFDLLRLTRAGQSTSISGKDEGYRTLDVTGRYRFNDHFDAYFKIINLFNKQYAGIRATRTADDLRYNPQNGFFFKVGMNYLIE